MCVWDRLAFEEEGEGYQYNTTPAAFREVHSLIEPDPKPTPEPKTEATRTALARLDRVAQIVRLLDGLDTHESTATLIACGDALHCPIREQTQVEFDALLAWRGGEPEQD